MRKNVCIHCHKYVRYNSQAFECDRCKQWVHRSCGTNISMSEFKDIARNIENGLPFAWECVECTSLKEYRLPIQHAIRRLHNAKVSKLLTILFILFYLVYYITHTGLDDIQLSYSKSITRRV